MYTETISKKKVKVTNRNNGTTGYALQNGVKRLFNLGQSMILNFDELELLQNTPGGDYLLRNLLIVEDVEALEELNIQTEPEYNYTEVEIKKLLMEGTLDQLEDALNFAPQGVIEIIKQMAVDMEIPDTRKRKMITEKTGFNIDNAITVRTIMAADSDTEEKSEAEVYRKAEPIEIEKPQRKASATISIK